MIPPGVLLIFTRVDYLRRFPRAGIAAAALVTPTAKQTHNPTAALMHLVVRGIVRSL